MLGAHRLVGLAHVDRILAIERGFQGVKRRPPLLVAGEQIGENGERRGLRLWRLRMLVRRVGRRRALRHHLVAVVCLGVVGCGGDAGIGQPVGRVLWGRGDRRAGKRLGPDEIRAVTARAASTSNCCAVLPFTAAPFAAAAARNVSVRRTASLAMSSRAKGFVSAAAGPPASRMRQRVSQRRA